jgi:DNA-binding MarR family transcriptional regulator
VTHSGRIRTKKGQPDRAPSPPMADTRNIDWELRLGFLIHDVSRLRRSAFDRCLKPMNVTRSQWWVLAYLSREDGMTQSQLAEELDLGKVAVGGLIDRLEKAGLLRREADASDRRVNRIFLEPKSKQLIARMRQINHRLNERILAGLPDAHLDCTAQTLAAMKVKLLDYLQSHEG